MSKPISIVFVVVVVVVVVIVVFVVDHRNLPLKFDKVWVSNTRDVFVVIAVVVVDFFGGFV